MLLLLACPTALPPLAGPHPHPPAGYQLWDSIQGLSSYVRGMLSSQAMLAGVGVGSAAATPLGAVFQVSRRQQAATPLAHKPCFFRPPKPLNCCLDIVLLSIPCCSSF